jgi:diacylglycerol kinase (ATP)
MASNFMAKCLMGLVHAARGLRHVAATQPNAWIHLAAAVAVVVAGAVLHIGAEDWLWLVACIGAVWTAEAMNSALE